MQCSGKSMALTWALSESRWEFISLCVHTEGGRAHCTLNSTQLHGVFCLSGSCCRLDLSLDRYWVVCARRFQLMDWSSPLHWLGAQGFLCCLVSPLSYLYEPSLLAPGSISMSLESCRFYDLEIQLECNKTNVKYKHICNSWVQIFLWGNDINISECPNL